MVDNKGFKLEVKNAVNGYSTLYPRTLKQQVVGWNIGEIFGPYNITLKANSWIGNTQKIKLDGVSSKDVVYCINVVSGNKENAKKQNRAYSLLSHYSGIISYDNEIKFICNRVPTIDIDLQVWWTK